MRKLGSARPSTLKKSRQDYGLPRALAILLLLLAVLPGGTLRAQTAPAEGAPPAQEASPQPVHYDPLNRTTPYGTVQGFIRAMAEEDFARAIEYFQLDEVPRRQRASRGEQLARELQQLLDSGGDFLPRWQLSDDPQGQLQDELPANQERVGRLVAGGEEVPILLTRVPSGEDGIHIWLFSAETLARIPDLAAQAEQSLLARILPETLNRSVWRGAPAGHWLAALVLQFAAFCLAWLIVQLLGLIATGLGRPHQRPWLSRLRQAATSPVALLLAVVFFHAIELSIGMSIIVRQAFAGLASVLLILGLVWLLWRLVNLAGETSIERMNRSGRPGAIAAIGLFRRFAKMALAALAVIALLDLAGFKVTTWLAALGIGGLALALGAQKAVENFIGGLILITDQPIRVGDFCRFGGITGTVEDIGMRSTRIRTLDRTLVTVPNGELSSLTIENFAHRDRFWFHPTLNLRYETTPDQLRYLLVELRAMLYAHPKVSPDPARVRFVGLGAFSLDLDIFAYVNARDSSEFLEIQEDLLLRILEIVKRSGTDFAFPSQTLYMARDSGPDPERTREAEEQVRHWRDQDELQLPQFDPERIAALRGSLDYPPRGSAGHRRR